MNLYIIRHAWAEDRDDSRFPDDALRPLTEEGRVRFAKFAKRLVAAGMAPTVIATSPFARCRETAEILAEQLSGRAELVEHAALEPGSDLVELLSWTAEQAGRDVAWVGHAPDVSDLTAALTGDGTAGIRFVKGAVAAIRIEGEIQRGGGELAWLVSAKILGI